MDFKTILRNLRRQDRMTQGELAEKLGVAKSTISMWENGARKPSYEMLEAIADYFNVNISHLLGDKTATPAQEGERRDDKIIGYLLSLPRDRLHGILLALGAPKDVLSALDHQERTE